LPEHLVFTFHHFSLLSASRQSFIWWAILPVSPSTFQSQVDASVTHPSGLRHACSILAKMVTDGYSLSAVHHDTLILGFGQARNLEAALAVFQVMWVNVDGCGWFMKLNNECLFFQLDRVLFFSPFLIFCTSFAPLAGCSFFRIKRLSGQLLLLRPTPLRRLLPNPQLPLPLLQLEIKLGKKEGM
jgi:pentatricopeptide repeat protein